MARPIFHIDVNSAFLSWEAARRVSLGEDDIFLNSNLLRRDEIKFVQRDPDDHTSTLFALSDFGTAGENGVRKMMITSGITLQISMVELQMWTSPLSSRSSMLLEARCDHGQKCEPQFPSLRSWSFKRKLCNPLTPCNLTAEIKAP